MSKNFKITEEEINQTILHSPYSLADSPSRQGLAPAQIKRYFYEFIRFLAEKINLHLDDIGKDADSANKKIASLEEANIYLGELTKSSLVAHNTGKASHEDIRNKIVSDIASHNINTLSHLDMRDLIKEIKDKTNAAFAIASGRQRVYPCDDILGLCDLVTEKAELVPGDMILLLDPDECDFIVYETNVSSAQGYAENPNDVRVSYDGIANGEVAFEAGKIYYLDGVRLLATKGNMETGLLAKDEDLDALRVELLENVAQIEASILNINNNVDTKETRLSIEESTERVVTLRSYTEYNLGLRTSVSLEIASEAEFDEAIVNFRAGETPTSFDAPASLYFAGDDCLDGRLYPNKNRIYEINIKSVMGILVARVGACDYQVIEA